MSTPTKRAKRGRRAPPGSGAQAAKTRAAVKAAADVYAPIAGTVTEVNQSAADAPEVVNQDAYAAWLFRMIPDDAADLDQMLDAAAYQAVADAA
jgi:glycine cleavage system H protein